MIGTKLAHYEVTSHLGSGGMGDVYQATDAKLGRSVAVKLLPDAFARDAERLSRFEREARVLASLNHPSIAAIYGLEEANDKKFLVMELVSGETLADRIARGPIPVDESAAIAKQMVDALEAAHEKGIIHRDLKPANVKITEGGAVKVLDFGLAKACEPDSATASLANSPTVMQATDQGVILGTAAYMAPEQARGRTVDKRVDIWAFGVVLFEMLAGRQLFSGDTLSDTLAAVLTREPDWTLLPPSTPPGVRRLLSRCLQRDPQKRLRDIGDARPEFEDAGPAIGPATSAGTRSLARVLAPWALTAAALLLAGWAFWVRPDSGMGARDVTRLDIGFPADVEPNAALPGTSIAPDGRSIVVIGAKDGVRRLFVREFDRTD
ncbi:MAG TPA: serine/threonine-protein kinase, partial [Vicinamibacterales bacterium]|nr:serine/threonine-protein kinase [Vicinamibacterales bacterium]